MSLALRNLVRRKLSADIDLLRRPYATPADVALALPHSPIEFPYATGAEYARAATADDRAFVASLRLKIDDGVIDIDITDADSAAGDNLYCTLFEGVTFIPKVNAESLGLYVAYSLSAPDPFQELTGGDPIPYYQNVVEIAYSCATPFALSLFRQILSRWQRTLAAEPVRDVRIIQDQQLPFDEGQNLHQRQTSMEVTTFEPDL